MSATLPTRAPGAPGGRPALGRRAVMGLASRPWTLILIGLLVLFTLWVISTRSQAHEVKAAFPSAVSIVPGLDVQANGVDVGKITSVEYSDGQAIVGIGIDDDGLWPLRRGTTATIRFGTTAGNGTRKIDLVPGPRTAPEIADGGIISAEFTRSPVEFDDVFRMMDREARDHMQSMTARTAATLEGRADELNRGIEETAPALEGAGGVFGDLAADEAALKGLIAGTHRATRAMASREGQISDLITVAGQTFQEFARNSRAVAESIDEAPAAMNDTRTTLARLDGTVGKLKAMVQDAAPGAAMLSGLAADARPAVSELATTAPRLSRLLRTGRRAAPDITTMLTDGAPFARRLTPILSELAPMLGCLRPYSPEIAGFVANWGSFAQNYDGKGHYARMNLMGGPTSITSSPEIKSTDAVKLGVRYALPRPPGLNEGKPWLNAECGAGPDALDPAKDPEDPK